MTPVGIMTLYNYTLELRIYMLHESAVKLFKQVEIVTFIYSCMV